MTLLSITLVLSAVLALDPGRTAVSPSGPIAEPMTDVVVMLSTGTAAEVSAGLPPGQFELRRTYDHLPAFAGRATALAQALLRRDPRVQSVGRDSIGHALTAESGPAIGATAVRQQLGVTGRGVTVAVLDTGVEDHHPDLDGGVVATKCFVLGGCAPMNTDVGDLAPEGEGHGTHVSGTITGDGRVAPPGIAPGAALVVIRVFDDNSVGRVSDWAAALDWVLSHHQTLGIRIVNLSLGTDTTFDGGCETQEPLLATAIKQLRAAGVISFAATGNDGEANTMSAPACIGAAVAVGATYDSDLGREPDTGTYACGCFDNATDAGVVACFSNSGTQLDLLAPGSRIRAAGTGGGVAEKRGTSQATPHAAAVAALMLEVDPTLTPDQLEQLLESTGSPRVDPKNARSTPFLDARAAVGAVHTGFCGRHGDGDRCLLTLPCDGGACAAGICFGGSCSISFPAVTPLPAASGCSTGAGSGALGLLLLGALARLRRARSG